MSDLPASSLSFQKNRDSAKCCSPEQSGSTVPPDTPGVYGNTRVPYFHPQQPSAWWRATQCARFIHAIVYRNPSASDAGPPGSLVSLNVSYQSWLSITSDSQWRSSLGNRLSYSWLTLLCRAGSNLSSSCHWAICTNFPIWESKKNNDVKGRGIT